MNALIQWFTSAEWALVVKALLHSLWQGGIVAITLGLAMRRMANPIHRYRLSLIALASVMMLGLATWGWLNRPVQASKNVQAPQPFSIEQTHPAVSDGLPPIVVTAIRRETETSPARWTAWLALVWLIGSTLMLGRVGFRVAGAERLRRSTRPLRDSRVAQLVAEAQRAVRLTRKIRVVVTDRLTSPAVVGVMLPTLILPLSLLTTLTPEQLRFVLLHELAHIRRGDYFANLFQLFAEALLFFNPAVWWISHQVRREREACCDALAIGLSGAPVDYARTLVQVAETILDNMLATAPAFAGSGREPSQLADRVQRLIVPGYRPVSGLTWRTLLASVVLGGAVLVFSAIGTRSVVGAVSANTRETEKPVQLEPVAAQSNLNYATSVRVGSPRAVEHQTVGHAPVSFHFSQNSDSDSDVADHKPIPVWDFSNSRDRTKFSLDDLNQARHDLEREGSKQWFWYRSGSNAPSSSSDPTRLSVDDLQGQPLVLYAAAGATSETQKVSVAVEPEKLFTRTFKVDMAVVWSNLRDRAHLTDTNTAPAEFVKAFRKLTADEGVDWSPLKAVFIHDRRGEILTRGTLEDLDKVEKVVQKLNTPPPQINIGAKFIEVPVEVMPRVMELLFTNSAAVGTNQFTKLLTEAKHKEFLKTLTKIKGVEILTSPQVVTLSGRQAQVQIVEMKTIVTGTVTVLTNGVTNMIPTTETMPFGPVLDVLPTLAENGHSIQMTIIPTVTEFLGYDDPKKFIPSDARLGKNLQPLPRFRVRQMANSSVVWDGQTILLGNFQNTETHRQPDGTSVSEDKGVVTEDKVVQKQKVAVLGDLPVVGGLFRSTSSRTVRKQLIVIVTPTLMAPSGNRKYPGVQVDGPNY